MSDGEDAVGRGPLESCNNLTSYKYCVQKRGFDEQEWLISDEVIVLLTAVDSIPELLRAHEQMGIISHMVQWNITYHSTADLHMFKPEKKSRARFRAITARGRWFICAMVAREIKAQEITSEARMLMDSLSDEIFLGLR
ncbi:hypothetical protein R3P38DRAFT_2762772 [Favolaschia claudopus]|uniref:Uncharacterized protein n=1 Tax=Favolaschia claudopus TaxID=2862362 RepID=A0AAW0DIF7_9AGAR